MECDARDLVRGKQKKKMRRREKNYVSEELTTPLKKSLSQFLTVKEYNGTEVLTFNCGLDGQHPHTQIVENSKNTKRSGSTLGMSCSRDPFYRRWAAAAVAPLLPEGYPHSVSADYASYQIWDTLQCLCSSVTGALSTRAVLMGVGVGHAEATALSGTLSWLIRDVWSKVGSVWFAAYFATDLDNDAKRWRYVADLANDAGLFLEIFSVHLPHAYFMLCACVACLFKAICGVAGGSSKTSLTQHFSLRHNMADVAAKDGSQETVASLIGMFLGMFFAWLIPETDFFGTCVGYLVFTSLHLYTNYRAVTSLVLTHFNRHRARHAIVGYLEKGGPWEGRVMGCEEANRRESVLILGKESREPFTIVCGARPSEVLARYSGRKGKATATEIETAIGKALTHIATNVTQSDDCRGFAVIADVKGRRYDVLLGGGNGEKEEEALLWAYYCVCMAHYHDRIVGSKRKQNDSHAAGSGSVDSTRLTVLLPSDDDGFYAFKQKAAESGWNLRKMQFRVSEWRVDAETS